MTRSPDPPKAASAGNGIVLAGIGRDGASIVHGFDNLPGAVNRLYLTASPTRAIVGSPSVLPIRAAGNWRDELRAAVADARMFVAVAAACGRESSFTPEVLALCRNEGALAVAVLVEPILSHSPHKGDAATELMKDTIRSADATMLFPAGPEAGAAISLSEALADWTRRLATSIRGLVFAAAADDAMDMDFTDVAAVLSGHCRATVGAGAGKTVEHALRDAAKNALAPPAELETAHSVFAHVVGDRDMPLDDARRVLPVLESLFPKAETGCGISVDEAGSGIQATIIAGKLEGNVVNPSERRRTLRAESPFFKVGNPTIYDGENLDIPAFLRADVRLPGSPPRPVPEQGSLFEPSRPGV